ncbi:MAG: TonB-dependent receptor, partial [Pseudazoarcus pumilus]|nr:TonB-dependent receptor [Pseudazoarcus pumilus]
MRFPLRHAVPLSCAVLTSMPTQAQEGFFEPLPVVLTASRLAQSPLDAPAPVTVIDREMIDASGFTEVHDLMRLVPGFLVADWPNGSPTVANHGMGDAFDRRIKVLVDGRTVNDPLWGNTLWQDLPLRVDDIDRIEVVRGPHGAAYGANAFQGVINIITRAPATESGFTVISRIGKDGFYDHGVRFNSNLDSPIDWRISASRRSARNFKSQTVLDDGDVDIYSQESIGRSVVNLQGSTLLSDHDELRLQLGLVDGVDDRGYPVPSEEAAEWPVRDEKVRSHSLHLAWTRSFDAGSEFTLQFQHQAHRRRVAWIIPDDGREIPTDLDTDTSRQSIEAQYSGILAPNLHFLAGAGVRRDAVRSRRYFDTGDTLKADYWHTFGSLTWRPIEKLAINLGGTYEHHDYSGKLFSPRLAFNYALTPLSALRLSAGKSFRAPSLMESHAKETIRYEDTIVRRLYNALQQVDAEEVRHVELGYVAQMPRYGLSIDARVFRDRYDGYLDDEVCRFNNTSSRRCSLLGFPTPPDFSPSPLSTSTYYFLNLGRTVVRGAEFTLDWKRPGWGRVVWSQAFTDIKTSRDMEEEQVNVSAPYSSTSLLLIKDLPGRWRASLGYYHQHAVTWLNDG